MKHIEIINIEIRLINEKWIHKTRIPPHYTFRDTRDSNKNMPFLGKGPKH
jgi:hypothetical protein